MGTTQIQVESLLSFRELSTQTQWVKFVCIVYLCIDLYKWSLMQLSTELHMLVSIQRQASLANKTERPFSTHSGAHCGYVWSGCGARLHISR